MGAPFKLGAIGNPCCPCSGGCSVVFHILCTGTPVSGASVAVTGGGDPSGTTASDGTVTLTFTTGGDYSVTITATGHTTRTFTIHVECGVPVFIDICCLVIICVGDPCAGIGPGPFGTNGVSAPPYITISGAGGYTQTQPAVSSLVACSPLLGAVMSIPTSGASYTVTITGPCYSTSMFTQVMTCSSTYTLTPTIDPCCSCNSCCDTVSNGTPGCDPGVTLFLTDANGTYTLCCEPGVTGAGFGTWSYCYSLTKTGVKKVAGTCTQGQSVSVYVFYTVICGNGTNGLPAGLNVFRSWPCADAFPTNYTDSSCSTDVFGCPISVDGSCNTGHTGGGASGSAGTFCCSDLASGVTVSLSSAGSPCADPVGGDVVLST